MPEIPIPPLGTYRLPNAALLGGPHPFSFGDHDSTGVQQLLEAGVDAFLDLTEFDEYGMPNYAGDQRHPTQEPPGEEIGYANFPIPDGTTPDLELLAQILNHLDRWLTQGRTVYVHCFAGIGRTGTVIGTWLVRSGLTGEEALIALNEARIAAGLFPGSPETDEQTLLVLLWADLDPDRQ